MVEFQPHGGHHAAMQIKRLCDVNFDLIGFIDGAWKKTANGNVGGMGGLIQGHH